MKGGALPAVDAIDIGNGKNKASGHTRELRERGIDLLGQEVFERVEGGEDIELFADKRQPGGVRVHIRAWAGKIHPDGRDAGNLLLDRLHKLIPATADIHDGFGTHLPQQRQGFCPVVGMTVAPKAWVGGGVDAFVFLKFVGGRTVTGGLLHPPRRIGIITRLTRHMKRQ